jgi:hypothetical protein
MRRLKYNNVKTELDGILFHSKKESKRYTELKLLLQSNEIQNLRLQVSYELIPSLKINNKTHRPIKYIADFVYIKNGIEVVEDVKGFITDIFKIKLRLMKLIHNIEIFIT